ncbi:MAG: aromatic amino acid hydroxylase [Flavobacteriales bacterium]|nr:aromatic amino acid hydroxylase [Flavobacteriales bacterium]
MNSQNRVPKHLQKYVVNQDYEKYTFQDHALWRFVINQNISMLDARAHPSYLLGLHSSGLNTNRIPKIEEINRVLDKVGWFAVIVNGFIPHQVYMEFQSNKILVIASEIRSIDQITYSPSPDIIHEAIGHIPLIGNKEYSDYLRRIGEVGKRAFSNKYDVEVFKAMRHLTIIKANKNTSSKDIDESEAKIIDIIKEKGTLSEMNQLKNLHWWTIGFGLIGDLRSPMIYGSGLLSSIGEGMNSLSDNVERVPFSIDSKDIDFDLTKQQTKLYVTPSFQWLKDVLDQFEKTMAFVQGGLSGIKKAVESEELATYVYNSGIQVSGVVSNYIEKKGDLIFVENTGKCQMSFSDVEIVGHGNSSHAEGLGTPVGILKGSEKCLSYYDQEKLDEFNIIIGEEVVLSYQTGIELKGVLTNILWERERIIMMSFENCIISYDGEVLFEYKLRKYDMAVGCSIISVYHGVADIASFGYEEEPPSEQAVRSRDEYDDQLDELYKEVRIITGEEKGYDRFYGCWEKVKENYGDEWLLSCAIIESLKGKDYPDLEEEIKGSIRKTIEKKPELKQVFEYNNLLDK